MAKVDLAPRDRMIEAAIMLMRRSGYSGVGINEVLAESGAPKGSLYHYFPDGKRQIAAEALSTYAGRVVAFIDENLARGRTPRGKVRALFDAFARRLEGSGYRQSCAAGCVSLDLEPDLENVRLAVDAAFDRYIEVIATHFPHLGTKRARSFGGFVLTAVEGAYIRGRAELDSDAFREAGDWIAEIVRGRLEARVTSLALASCPSRRGYWWPNQRRAFCLAGSCAASHAKNSSYQSRELRGFITQWPSSGNHTRRAGTPRICKVL